MMARIGALDSLVNGLLFYLLFSFLLSCAANRFTVPEATFPRRNAIWMATCVLPTPVRCASPMLTAPSQIWMFPISWDAGVGSFWGFSPPTSWMLPPPACRSQGRRLLQMIWHFSPLRPFIQNELSARKSCCRRRRRFWVDVCPPLQRSRLAISSCSNAAAAKISSLPAAALRCVPSPMQRCDLRK